MTTVMFFSVFIFEQKDRTGLDRIDFVLYRACLDPFADWNSSIVGNQVMMPFYFILVYGMNIVNIASNFYLYFYLEDQRKNNTGPGKVFYLLKVSCFDQFLLIAITDLKKERARNLLPAYVGVYGIIIFLINTIMINLAHGPTMVIHLELM